MTSFCYYVSNHTKTYVATEYPAHDRTNLLMANWTRSGSSSPNWLQVNLKIKWLYITSSCTYSFWWSLIHWSSLLAFLMPDICMQLCNWNVSLVHKILTLATVFASFTTSIIPELGPVATHPYGMRHKSNPSFCHICETIRIKNHRKATLHDNLIKQCQHL